MNLVIHENNDESNNRIDIYHNFGDDSGHIEGARRKWDVAEVLPGQDAPHTDVIDVKHGHAFRHGDLNILSSKSLSDSLVVAGSW